MTIDKRDIEKLSQLARITISPDSIEPVTDRINKVLNMVDQLQSIDTSNIAPMSHPLDAVQRLRADEVTETNERDTLMENAPAKEDGLFLVPRVID